MPLCLFYTHQYSVKTTQRVVIINVAWWPGNTKDLDDIAVKRAPNTGGVEKQIAIFDQKWYKVIHILQTCPNAIFRSNYPVVDKISTETERL